MGSALELTLAAWEKFSTGVSAPIPPGETADDLAWKWDLAIVWTVILLLVNIGLTRLIFKPLAWCLMGERTSKSKVEKFAQSGIEALFYTSSLVLGVVVIKDQAWAWPSIQWWQEVGSQKAALSLPLRFFYMTYFARYSQGIVAVMFLDNKRKDYWEMIVHHVTTVLVVYVSYSFDIVRVGCVIMVLFDIGDPPLHFAKMCKYISETKPPNNVWATLADVFFGIFAVVFGTTRLGMYGYVVWSCLVENYAVVSPELPLLRALLSRPSSLFCNLLLLVLLLLQIFWFGLLCQAIHRVLTGLELKDTRSDCDSDADVKPTKKD